IPLIKNLYDTVKSKGVEVYAVCTGKVLDEWAKYVRDHKLDWVNVIDLYNISQFRTHYNINTTPQVFVLDKDKKIIAKRLNAEQLKQLLYDKLGMEYVAPPEDHSKDDGHGH
ncbi:MAG TPA: thioredoxin-like domain-containing protein, partial [Niastella sp.]|nr:thioredoxin-like domain-containing protein [Niastella sp.]